MCAPVVAVMAVSAALSLADAKMKKDALKQSNVLKDEAVDLHRKVYANKIESVGKQFRGQQIQAGEAKHQRSIEAMQARATSQAGASASGITGLSVDAVLDDFTRQEGTGNSVIDQSLALQSSSTNTSIKALGLGTEGSLFNLRKETFNPVSAALGIGKAAFGTFVAAGGASGGGGNKDD